MIIAKFYAENFKNIRVVDITPDPDNPTVLLTGPNGAGKSSILDAIEAAIAGGKATKTRRPIRDGQDHAEVRLQFGEFDVLRTWDRKVKGGDEFETKMVLRQRAPEPLEDESIPFYHVARPQELLDRFWSALAMDPLEFLERAPKAQQAALVGLVALPFDPVQLDNERGELYAQRTDVGRTVKQLEGQLAGYQAVPGLPDKEQSATALVDELRALDQRDRFREERTSAIAAHHANVSAWTAQIETIREQIKASEEAAQRALGELTKNPAVDPAERERIRKSIDNLDTINGQVRAEQERLKVAGALKNARTSAENLTLSIAAIDDRRAEGLAAAKFPVPGLGFDDEGVTYMGVPLSQVSQAEQWKVAFGIAVAANPGLRVFRINQGSLIDSKNMALIVETAREHDAQVWIEVVDESGDVGIVINAGQVVTENGATA